MKRFIVIAFLFYAATGFAAGREDAQECTTRGKVVYEKCVVCHAIIPEQGHGVAPNLFGILDKPVGKQEGFKYSRALRKSELSWTAEHLQAFLENPMQVYPGTSMAFAGLKKGSDRDNLFCYLTQHQ